MSNANANAQFPAVSAPMVDPKTGTITRPWVKFFLDVWNRAFSNSSTLGLSLLWKTLAHDGVSAFFSQPVFLTNFNGPTYQGPAIVLQGNDWWIYVLNPTTGQPISGWPYPTTGPCYGRCQAQDVNADGFTEVFGCTHGNQSGQTGSVYCLSAGGAVIWNLYNVYQQEGHNDGILNGSVVGGSTATGGPVAAASASTLTVGDLPTPTWPANAWTRTEGVGQGASVYITSGTGAGQHLEILSVSGGNILNLNGTWGTIPDTSSKYQIVPRYTSDLIFQHAGTLNQEGGVWYLYITGDDNTLVKVNASTGAVIWRYWAGENNEPYPFIADVLANGTPQIMFNSVDGKCRNLNPDGSLNWTYTSPTGLDSFIDAADVNSDGHLEVLINQRRSGNGAGGRSVIVNGQTGVAITQSSDNFGDMDSKPLPVPRNDGSNLIDVFFVGDAGFCSLMDFTGLTLWQDNRGDTNAFAGFNCSPQLADVNYDGQKEIIACNQQGGILVYDTSGNRLATFVLPSRVGSGQVGIEGIPYIGDINNDGLLEFVISSVDGYVYCYQWKKFAAAGSG